MRKGMFIVLDGNDGSGKATQAQLLVQRLKEKGAASVKMDFPAYERNFFGAFIGECLAGAHGDFLRMDPKIASALYALDRLESSDAIRSAIADGAVVIADRFSSSNQIHQGGKIANDAQREAFLAWLDRMEHEVLKIPRPDSILYLRVPPEISLTLLHEKRAIKNQHLEGEAQDVVEQDRTYLEQSYATADWLARRQANWHIIDCARNGVMRPVNDIHQELSDVVERLIRG